MKKRFATAFAILALAPMGRSQELKVNALAIAWFVQNLDGSARNNAAPAAPLAYYGLGGTNAPSTFQNGGFGIRRTELYFAVKITDQVSANVMFDPNQSAPNLYDAFITFKPTSVLEVKVGQFKPLQTFEATSVSSADLIFVDRAQLARRIGDDRDRGLTAAYAFGDKAFGGKATLGVFNGAVRANEGNAHKDWVARLDFNLGAEHRFGAYALQGETDLAYKEGAPLVARTFAGPGPAAAEVLSHRDKTANLGAYYTFNRGPWHADAEVIRGLLGRRFASLATTAPAGAALRQHLDQAYFGYYLTGAYTTGHHILAARWDFMNYNQGDKWYTAYNPYRESAPGVSRADGADYSPRFRELTLGYTYAFKPESIRAANIKVNYINRSHNYLAPNAARGETGEKGSDSVVVAFQAWF